MPEGNLPLLWTFSGPECLFCPHLLSPGGYFAHSLAIMTDAAHLLTDFASMMISLFSLWMSSRPATKTMNFGWHRAGNLTELSSAGGGFDACLLWLQNWKVGGENLENFQSCRKCLQELGSEFCQLGAVEVYVLTAIIIKLGMYRAYQAR